MINLHAIKTLTAQEKQLEALRQDSIDAVMPQINELNAQILALQAQADEKFEQARIAAELPTAQDLATAIKEERELLLAQAVKLHEQDPSQGKRFYHEDGNSYVNLTIKDTAGPVRGRESDLAYELIQFRQFDAVKLESKTKVQQCIMALSTYDRNALVKQGIVEMKSVPAIAVTLK